MKLSVAIFATTTFLTPLHVSLAQAQESSTKSCSLVTELNGAGEVVWSENADIASLVVDAKTLEISPADYKALCAGEEIVQEAASEDATEEDATEGEQESTEVASEDVDVEAETKESIMSSAGVIAPLAGLGLVAGGGGGGGGGGSSSSSTFLDESTTYTYSASLDSTWTSRQEYKNVAQYHSSSTIHPYTLIGVNYAYGMGLSGTGKTIAIVDDEFRNSANLTHAEFGGKSITAYNTLSAGGPASTSYHGMHVAGLAAADYNSNSSLFDDGTNTNWGGTRSLNGLGGDYNLLSYGFMGVAYEADLHLTDYSITMSALAAATDSANAAGAIAQNNSWGWGNCQTNDCPQTIDVWVTYQNNNGTTDAQTLAALTDTEAGWTAYLSAMDSFQDTGVVVVAAGNDSASSEVNVQAGLPQIATELADAWLVVGNVDTSGSTIDSSSVTRQGNQCGVAAQYCVQADGTHVTSTVGGYAGSNENGRYQVYSGTSMAAPIVSGTVALLAQAFPNHTPAQLTDRILASANNDFFTATGTTTFINGVTHGYNAEFGHGIVDLSTALQPIKTSSMIPPMAGYNASNTRYGNINTARRFALSSTQVQLGAAFGDAISNSLNGNKAYFYDALNGGFAFDLGSLVKSRSTAKTSTHSFESVMGGNTITNREALNGASFMSDASKGNLKDGSLMAFMPISKNLSSFVGNNIHIQNAMNFTRRSDSVTTGLNSDNPFNIPFLQASEQGTSVGNKLSVGDGRLLLGLFSGESKDYGMKTSGFVSEYGREIANSYASLFIGLTNENDGFLETSVEGAFAEDSRASTTFSGISGYGWLNDIWSYNALGSIGFTQMSVDGVGLLSDIENITSSSFAFEVARPVGLNERDSFHIGLSQPLRVENGNATISIPQLYETNGNLSFNNVDADLSPSGRQLDLNLGYQASLNNLFNVGIQMAFSQDYGHIKSDEIIHSAAVFMKFDF